MKHIILSVFLIAGITKSFGDFIKKDSINRKFILGSYQNLVYQEASLENDSKKFGRIFSCSIRPYVAYNVSHNLFVGTQFSYEFFKSNYYQKETFIDVGLFARYIIPYTIQKKVLNRVHFYIEAGYYRTNYKVVDYVVNTFEYKNLRINETFYAGKSLNYSLLTVPVGVNLRGRNHFYFDFNFQNWFFVKGKYMWGFMSGIGFTF